MFSCLVQNICVRYSKIDVYDSLRKACELKNVPKSRKCPKGGGSGSGSSSTKGHLPPKVIFQQRSSSTEGRLPPKIIFHQSLSSTKGRLQPKVVFHQSSSSTKDRLPPTITPYICESSQHTKSTRHAPMFPKNNQPRVNMRRPKLYEEFNCNTSRYYNSSIPYMARLLNQIT